MRLGSSFAAPAFEDSKNPAAQIKSFVAEAAILVKSGGRQSRESGGEFRRSFFLGLKQYPFADHGRLPQSGW